MTRSYNSRKGTYKRCCDLDCTICFKRRNKYFDIKRWKRNFLQFDGVLFKYKRKKKKKKEYLGHWLSQYHIDEVEKSKKSYRDWSWLKGKPNKKGRHHTGGKYVYWSGSLR